jgi:cytosine/uracil/thiamine/allantoin permease
MKNRNLVNFSILLLLMAVMVINNIEGLDTFKTLMNSFAILTLSVIGVVYATNYVKRKKQAM